MTTEPNDNDKPPEVVLPPGTDPDDYARAQQLVNGFMAGWVKITQANGGRPPCSPNALNIAMMFSTASSFVDGKTPKEQYLALARLAYDNALAAKAFVDREAANARPDA